MKSAFLRGTSARSLRFKSLFLGLAILLAPLCARAAETVFPEVVRRARDSAAVPFQPNEAKLPEILSRLNYDTYRDITFRGARALWHDAGQPFEVQFFHPGYLFKHPVQIHEVVAGETRPVPFSPKYFRYPDFPSALLRNESALGFAGFRLLYPLNHPGRLDEVISFVGSNYFRALAAGQIYGLSARGVAINTGENLPEEFPEFREFWLCRPEHGARVAEFYGLLDGPSVAGAYRFVVRPGKETVVEVEARLFFRQPVQLLGIAPLTSMFWRGEDEPHPPNDKRPEVHDSDGVLLGSADWHPLRAVEKPTTQTWPQENAPTFSLLQRDRDPAHYHDREAHYDRRPSVRVEPVGDWGKGAVQLLQLPTANEYNDNVVLFWRPEKAPQKGDALEFQYRLHWFTEKIE